LTAFGVFSTLRLLLSLSVAPAPGVDNDAATLGRVILGVLAIAQIAIGVWWLVFLNRPSVRNQFMPRQAFNAALSSTTYPMQASYETPPPPAGVAAVMPPGRKRPLSISIIAWFVLVGCAFVPINLALHTPAALFLWTLTGW
jgi:hypothetical protein